MHPVLRPLLYSLYALFALAAVGIVVAFVSNNASNLLTGGDGTADSGGSPDQQQRALFYDDGVIVSDRIVDPRDQRLLLFNQPRQGNAEGNGDGYGKGSGVEDPLSGWANGEEEGLSSTMASTSSIPVIALPLGHALPQQVIYFNNTSKTEGSRSSSLRKRVYELVGISEGGYGYEVKVSFLGSPPTNFDLKLFTLPRDAPLTAAAAAAAAAGDIVGCPCGRCECSAENDDSGSVALNGAAGDADAGAGGVTITTRRQLMDIDKVMFKSMAMGTAERAARARTAEKKKKAEQAGAGKGGRTCCCSCDVGATVSPLNKKKKKREVERATPSPPVPFASPRGEDGVSYYPRRIALDKTVAAPYEAEHVVRHYESIGAAQYAMGVRFDVAAPLPSTGVMNPNPAAGDGGAVDTIADGTSSRGSAGNALDWLLSLGTAGGRPSGAAVVQPPNRLFVVVSAYPKGVARKRSVSAHQDEVSGGRNHYFRHLGDDDEDFSSVRFTINLERMYFGAFPIAIVLGLLAAYPIAAVLWAAVVPRVVDAARLSREEGGRGEERREAPSGSRKFQ